MDEDRSRRWTYVSHGLARINHFAPVIAQGLGRLDCELVENDRRLIKSGPESWESLSETLLFDAHLTQSYLWVLGAYELVRTIDQRCAADTSLYGSDLASIVRAQKHRFERLRIPLAKMEPSRRHPSDSSIAYPTFSLDYGVAWQLDEDVFISRRELSDELLLVLEGLRVLGQEDA